MDTTATRASAANPSTSRPVFAARYQTIEVLKAARGVTTYRGVDLDTRSPVIVKAADLRSVPEGTELLLRHEADVLSRLASPCVAPLMDAGADGEFLYLIVPVVEGVTLRDRLAADGALSVDDTLALAHGLVSGLVEVFAHGVLHRDIKPANIIVNADHPLTEVTLIDFGFSRSDQLAESLRDVPLGTARYASPEQAGVVGHDADERSDLYSVGVVLFEALAGRPPFQGETVGDVLRQHLTAPVPSLRDLGIRVPRALDELVSRLLAKEPQHRYQTAGALLHDLDLLRAARAGGNDDPTIVLGTQDRRCCALGEPAFVGRVQELERLDAQLGRAARGRVSLVSLEAESGGGKTRLLEEFAHRCAEQGAWVVHGQGIDQAAQRPFQTLQGVADAVMALADEDPAFAPALRARLGDHRTAICAALPDLDTVLAPDVAVTLGPEAHGAARSVAALAELLDALGTPERPAVVVLDDCQWADHLSVQLLHRWRRKGTARHGHVIVVAAFRSEEVGAGHGLRDAGFDAHVALPPLGDEEVQDLIESMAGRLEADAVRTVVSLAEGSPFMASAVLHGLVEAGALVCRHPGWSVDGEALASARSSNRAATFLAHRLDLLPPEAQSLLAAAAVLGKEFDLELAAHLADQDASTAIRSRDDGRRRHLVWARGHGARCVFVHDKVREAFLGRMNAEERRALHAAAARRLELVDRGRTFELAYHFDAAGEPELALPYALAAAEQARSQHGLEIALDQYQIAQRGLDHASDDVRSAVAEGLGDVTMLLGQYDAARPHFVEAQRLAESSEDMARIEARIAELEFKTGDLEAAAGACERGLRHLGRRVPKTTAGFAVWAVWEIVVQAFHTLFPRWLLERRSPDHAQAERDLLAARHYSRLAHVYWFARGPIPTLWTHLKEMNVAERYPATRELAQAYSEHAPVMTILPWFSRGIHHVKRSFEIRKELNDVWGQGQSLNFWGIVLLAAGRLEETVQTCREAIRLLERTGDRWELNIARLHLAFAWYRLGEVGRAIEMARVAHEDGLEIGDLQASGLGIEIWAKAGWGRVPADLTAAELERDTVDYQLRSEVLQGDAVRRFHEGDLEGAEAQLLAARRAARGGMLRNEYVAPTNAWLATVRRHRAESVAAWAPARRRAIRRARRAARAARWIARSYRNNLPHALRESALVDALAGRRRRARSRFRKSARVADAQRARLEVAATMVDYGRVGAALGWDDAQEWAARGASLMKAVRDDADRVLGGSPSSAAESPTLSLVERFDTLLDQGRRIAGALSREAVFQAVEDAVATLLRAEHCVVLDLHDGDFEDTSEALALSSSLVHDAVESGRATISRGDGGDASESLLLADVRSALCAPIFERGEITACFYATHQRVTSLFGDDEVRLAEFIVALAGAALENASGFAETEALQRSLEHRVAERTQQLTTTLHELERLNAELRDANQTKSDFVSMVSHELRTPLTPIVGLSSTMLQRWESMDEALREECLTSIHRQGTRLARLVDDLLEMSRIEAGTLEAEPRDISVREIIELTLQGFSGASDRLDISCPDGLVARADPDRLQQILLNYLENARKYGGGATAIDVTVDGSWIEFSVSDAGPGVPEEFTDRLFEKFSRVPGAQDVAGTGLGLSIVRGLADAQGGSAWYEPNQPQGARFCVRLPRSRSSSAAPATAFPPL